MAVTKFAESGLFLSCGVKEFEDSDQMDTKAILTDFTGRLTRIAQSCKRAESSNLKIEADEELTSIVFCSNICEFGDGKRCPSEIQICGDQLCWISEESQSLATINIKKTLEKVMSKGNYALSAVTTHGSIKA